MNTKQKSLKGIFMALVMIFSLFGVMPQVELEASATTSADLNISQNGIDFICSLEGFHSTCYSDYNQSSIGYGTKCNGSSVQPHASGLHSITKEQAMIDMKNEIESSYIPNVRRQTSGIEMNQNQFDALVSLTYNCGGGTTKIKNSPLVKYLRGELSESDARSQYSNYIVTAGGNKLQGLVNRRNKEADLFFTPISIPEKPNLYIEKEFYSIDEMVNITWNATKNTESYWLHIYRDGNEYINQSINQDLSYSSKYPVGSYTVYIVACNNIGETISSVDFVVYDTAPEKPNPYIEKELYSINETVNITWNATKNTESYWLHIYRDGNEYINQSINQDLSYSSKYPVGSYTVYIVACNNIGETLSSVKFHIIEKGDLNQDNVITISDIVILQKYILGIQSLTQEQAKFADMTHDGIVNILDLSVLKHKILS